ncbi:MAG TPA: hypothetical protein VEA38_00880 [Terriglobales bacterium]|nr:hypothetical protein [Terriglobales bacterium]
MKVVEISGLGVVEFPDSMTDAAISAKAAELSRSAQPTPGPATHPWVQANEAARQGLMPTGEPIGQAATAGAVDLAATATRFVPPLLASPAPMIAGPVAGVSEAAAQGVEMAGGARQEMDPAAIATSAAIPPVMKPVTSALQWGAKKLPGAAATLHQMAKESLERMASIFGPAQASDELYAIVRQQNPSLAMPRLKEAASKLLDAEKLAEAGLELPAVAKTARALDVRLEPVTLPWAGTQPGEMAFDKAFLNLKRIGGKIRETRLAGGEEHGAWKVLWREGMKDLEAAAANGDPAAPAVQALKQANAAARREYVSEEIADIFTKGGMTARPDLGPDAFAVNFGKIANDLRKGKHADDIKAVLTPAEYKGLLARVSELAQQTPNLPPPRGQFAGSAVRLGQAAGSGALGYLAGPALGLPADQATALGVVVGTKGVDVLTRLLMSDPGRQVLTHFLSQSGGIVTQKTLSLLGLAAAQLPEVKGVTAHLGALGREYMTETK